ncbi:TPA: DUF2088 domain-containing protein, partial [Candidatus Bathyarchaeota archaeon]|nr:DUF2088 domain-containing protein [Candidatus Bathyarchaeota archaeon]
MKSVSVPAWEWYGWKPEALTFPDGWDVNVQNMKGHGAKALKPHEIKEKTQHPTGTKPLSELAKGKRKAVIIFDDMTRPTKTTQFLPAVLDELHVGGITDDKIVFMMASGAHTGRMLFDFQKKLGEEICAKYNVFNHNPYEGFVDLGKTSRGTPILINKEVTSCDLKVTISSIMPHFGYGFGGGSKIILPGVASITTIDLNHTRLFPHPSAGIGKYEGNILKRDMNDAARMAGLDIKVDCIYNFKRQVTHLFVGDVVDEHVAGVNVAREYWATDDIPDCDIVIANCFSKADEMSLALPVTAPLLKKSGGDLIVLVITPEGQINHYWARSFGVNLGGRNFRPKTALPANTKRFTIMQPYP